MDLLSMAKRVFQGQNAAKQPRWKVRRLQEEKLRALLRYAFENSAYYKRAFSEAGITAENIDTTPFEDFPTLSKELVVENYEDILTQDSFTQDDLIAFDASRKEGELFLDKYQVIHSSGSTGKPVFFTYDPEAWQEVTAGAVRCVMWGMGAREIMRIPFANYSLMFLCPGDGAFGSSIMTGAATKAMRVTVESVSISRPMEEWVEAACRLKPNLYVTYPSAMVTLIAELERRGIQLSAYRVICCGESLSPLQKVRIGEYFKCPVVSFYAATESLALGAWLDDEEMVLMDDLNYFEVVDGKTYLTSLYNYGQPLIRYYMGDVVTMLPPHQHGGECCFSRCKIGGARANELLALENDEGDIDYLLSYSVEDFCHKSLVAYQFVQTDSKHFCVNAQTLPEADEAAIVAVLTEGIRDVLVEKHMETVEFEVRLVDDIPVDSRTGKRKRFIAVK